MTMMTLTAKRQATFPKDACEAMGLKPGDQIELEPRVEGGTRVWVLRPRPNRTRDWVGVLGSRARKVQDHSMAAVRRSIAAGQRKSA